MGAALKRGKMMDSDDKAIVALLLGLPMIFFLGLWLLRPSPMQTCIKAGYEWRGGECVKGVDHAQ